MVRDMAACTESVFAGSAMCKLFGASEKVASGVIRGDMFATMHSTVVCFFFFFQAEDGIRDLTVTGVQTCALPILRSVFAGISDQFRDASGFIGRAGIVHSYVDPSYTAYGGPGAWLQRFTGDVLVDGIWQYQNFIHGRHLQDKKLHFNGNATLRGGWNVGAGYFVESFGYDSALYAAYWVKVPKVGGGDTTVQF